MPTSPIRTKKKEDMRLNKVVELPEFGCVARAVEESNGYVYLEYAPITSEGHVEEWVAVDSPEHGFLEVLNKALNTDFDYP